MWVSLFRERSYFVLPQSGKKIAMHQKHIFLRTFPWYCLSLLIKQQNRTYVKIFIRRFQILLLSTMMNIKITLSLSLPPAETAVGVERAVTSDLAAARQALASGSRWEEGRKLAAACESPTRFCIRTVVSNTHVSVKPVFISDRSPSRFRDDKVIWTGMELFPQIHTPLRLG